MRTTHRVLVVALVAILFLTDAAVAASGSEMTPSTSVPADATDVTRVSDERLGQVLPPLGAFPRGTTRTGPTSGTGLSVCGEVGGGPTPVRASSATYATPSGNAHFIVVEEHRNATAARQRMQRISRQYRRVCGRGADAVVRTARPLVRIGRATDAFTRTRRLTGRVVARDYATFHRSGRFVIVTQVVDLDFVDPPRIENRQVRKVHRALDRRVDALTG